LLDCFKVVLSFWGCIICLCKKYGNVNVFGIVNTYIRSYIDIYIFHIKILRLWMKKLC